MTSIVTKKATDVAFFLWSCERLISFFGEMLELLTSRQYLHQNHR
jgi:hypothetical protein